MWSCNYCMITADNYCTLVFLRRISRLMTVTMSSTLNDQIYYMGELITDMH